MFCATLMCGNSALWNTVCTGRFRLDAGEVLAVEADPPPSGWSKPASMRRRVVLPHPEGPRRVKNSPVLIVRLTLSTAVKSPKRRVTLRISSKGRHSSERQ